MLSTLQRIMVVLFLLCGAACVAVAGEIPKGYRGVFAAQTGEQLELKESQAFWRVGQQTIKLSVEREPYAKIYARLLQGKSGLYLEEPARQTATLTGFGVIFETDNGPALPAQGGLQWRRARVFYFTINREQVAPVASLTVTTSNDGLVTLDTLNTAWQIGWGPDAVHSELQRTSSTK